MMIALLRITAINIKRSMFSMDGVRFIKSKSPVTILSSLELFMAVWEICSLAGWGIAKLSIGTSIASPKPSNRPDTSKLDSMSTV
jgi:hypothetical protein